MRERTCRTFRTCRPAAAFHGRLIIARTRGLSIMFSSLIQPHLKDILAGIGTGLQAGYSMGCQKRGSSRAVRSSRTGVNGLPLTGKSFPKFQCSLCHDWFRGKDGSEGGHFSRELLLHRKAMSVQVGGGFRGEDGSEGAIFSRDSFYMPKACPYR